MTKLIIILLAMVALIGCRYNPDLDWHDVKNEDCVTYRVYNDVVCCNNIDRNYWTTTLWNCTNDKEYRDVPNYQVQPVNKDSENY